MQTNNVLLYISKYHSKWSKEIIFVDLPEIHVALKVVGFSRPSKTSSKEIVFAATKGDSVLTGFFKTNTKAAMMIAAVMIAINAITNHLFVFFPFVIMRSWKMKKL